jgi:HAD superfamily hydrolase (TIGR01549 family)
MPIKLIVFDLDGTLMDSSTTIYKAVMNTFDKLNIPVHLPQSDFENTIGAHFHDIFKDFNIELTDFEEFLEIYLSVYFNYIDDTKFYPGVIEVLRKIKNKNFNTAILTTKAQGQTDTIVKNFNLNNYFNYIMGRRTGIEIKPSPKPLLEICKALSVSPSETLMVGDSELDLKCGKSAGALTCGVTYGYRSRESLQKENPDYLIDTIEELMNVVLKINS